MADAKAAWANLSIGGAGTTANSRPWMVNRPEWSRLGGRGGLLLLVLLGHLLAFLLVIRTGLSAQESPLPPLRLITVSASSVPAPAPPAPTESQKAPERQAQAPEPQLPAAAQTPPAAPQIEQLAGGPPAGGGCALAAEIGVAIQNDLEAMNALAMLPADLRSTADAVMLWNGQWVAPERPDSRAGILLLQQVIERSVIGATPECRYSANAGPQFIPVSDRDRTTMIVVGSGEWRWDSLVASGSLGAAPPVGTGVSDRSAGQPASWWQW